MTINPAGGFAGSLRSRITIMFVIVTVVAEGLMGLYWLVHLAPALEAGMEANIRALAQSQVNGLADALNVNRSALGSEPHTHTMGVSPKGARKKGWPSHGRSNGGEMGTT